MVADEGQSLESERWMCPEVQRLETAPMRSLLQAWSYLCRPADLSR